MHRSDLCLISSEPSDPFIFGGLFLEPTIPSSFVSLISPKSDSISCSYGRRRKVGVGIFLREKRFSRNAGGGFLSVSLSITGSDDDGFVRDSAEILGQNGEKSSEEEEEVFGEEEKVKKVKVRGSGAMNTTKHLWAGAVSAMVSRTFVAPLERLKLEYIVRGEQKNLFELIKTIATSQGLKGFWKGNFVNILRTAPFKAINFYAYDTYRSKLIKLSGNEETTNFEKFVAGAAAGITATLLCLPMDTVRTGLKYILPSTCPVHVIYPGGWTNHLTAPTKRIFTGYHATHLPLNPNPLTGDEIFGYNVVAINYYSVKLPNIFSWGE